MRAEVLFEALAILRAAKDEPSDVVPGVAWIRIARVVSEMEVALIVAGLQIPIEAKTPQQVAA